ncbi:unnamed protein product [Prorocentrum cordatum]|uniref:Uncharacterized protein n=1 Tax=Prorocentrum cordatum TaxID=2364126 RepID=A0ABN9R000_9DINO|nr:unnamed protein product [Polarella glacialis]
MLPAQAKEYLEELASRMLLPPQEAALIRELDGLPGCHTDPLLLPRPRSYGKFARRALSIGLVTLPQRPKSVLGLFVVKKKDGARLRLIVDCRRSNALFRPPPGVDLLSGEGLGRVEMPIMGASDFAGLCAVLGVGDAADCFHGMKLQGDIRHYFSWPPLDAALTGETLVERRPVHAGEQVWPMSQSLPMGFSWSLYFAQAANQRRLDRQPSLAGSLRLSDRGPPLVLGRGTVGSELGHYMYVDNAGVIGFDAARVTCALQEAQRDFDGDHLKFHEVEVMPEGGRTLGCYLDGRHRATRPTDERFAMVRKGVRCLLRRRKVAGWQLEMVLGHMTFMALVRREVLSIFHSVYAFVAQSYHAFSELWPTVREELNCYLGIMVMLESSWTRPWMPVVYPSDASLHGYGVAEACSGTETVAEIGRVSELARWRLGAGLARQHAFECAGFLLDSETGEVVRDEAGAPKRLDAELQRVLASERWELDPSFPEVPSWLLNDSHWATVMADRWAFADDILRLEARALVKAGRRRTRALSSPGRPLDSGGPPPAQRSRTLDQRRGLAARLVLEGAARPPQQSSVEACLQLSPGGPHLADQAVAGHGVAEVAAESESIESSDVEEPPAAARSRRRLETCGKARVRKAIEVLEITETGKDDVKLGISYLEKRSVGAGTLETYRQRALAFCVWARCCLTALPELKELGGQLVEYMNEEFLKGVKAWRGEKLLAGLMFFHPDFGRLGGLHLPRSLRCLKGWKKLSPSRSRKPLVFAIWAALAVELCRLGAPLVGAMVLIMMECYLRPGEMLSLTSDSFLAPTEHAVQNWVAWLFPEAGVARSKVGSADDTIPCDSGRCPWMCHIFKALKDRQSSRPLLDLSYPQFLCLFRRAATNIGVDVVPYQGELVDCALCKKYIHGGCARSATVAKDAVEQRIMAHDMAEPIRGAGAFAGALAEMASDGRRPAFASRLEALRAATFDEEWSLAPGAQRAALKTPSLTGHALPIVGASADPGQGVWACQCPWAAAAGSAAAHQPLQSRRLRGTFGAVVERLRPEHLADPAVSGALVELWTDAGGLLVLRGLAGLTPLQLCDFSGCFGRLHTGTEVDSAYYFEGLPVLRMGNARDDAGRLACYLANRSPIPDGKSLQYDPRTDCPTGTRTASSGSSRRSAACSSASRRPPRAARRSSRTRRGRMRPCPGSSRRSWSAVRLSVRWRTSGPRRTSPRRTNRSRKSPPRSCERHARAAGRGAGRWRCGTQRPGRWRFTA